MYNLFVASDIYVQNQKPVQNLDTIQNKSQGIVQNQRINNLQTESGTFSIICLELGYVQDL